MNLITVESAREAVVTVDGMLDHTRAELGSIGATQSRLGIIHNSLVSLRDAFETAASRITDVDVAFESAELVRNLILQQAATAILAQANFMPQLALELLKDT